MACSIRGWTHTDRKPVEPPDKLGSLTGHRETRSVALGGPGDRRYLPRMASARQASAPTVTVGSNPALARLRLTPDNPTAGCSLLGTGVRWPLLAPGADIRHGRSHADRDA